MKRKTLIVDQAQLDALNELCEFDGEGGGCEVYFDNEVVFDDGCRMAIQVCASSSDTHEEFPPPAWTQGVLFSPEGSELGCTEVGDSLDGEYQVDNYIVLVTGG